MPEWPLIVVWALAIRMECGASMHFVTGRASENCAIRGDRPKKQRPILGLEGTDLVSIPMGCQRDSRL